MLDTEQMLAQTGLAQCVIFKRDGTIVQSHGDLIGEMPPGESLFDQLSLVQGFESAIATAKPEDEPISLAGVSLPNRPPLESFDFSMRSHPNGTDIVMMVSRNAALSGREAQRTMARRKERFFEGQLLRERARFEYIYENTPVKAFAHYGMGNIRAMTGELRRWLGADTDPLTWIAQIFPNVMKTFDHHSDAKRTRRMAVSKANHEIALVDVTTLRAPAESGLDEYLIVIEDVTHQVASINSLLRHKTNLEAASDELTTSNRRLEQFAYVAAHDLLGPLGRMATFSEIIELELADKHAGIVSTAISAIRSSSVESLDLVKDLLTLAKLSHSTPVPERVGLEQVFGYLVAQLPAAANATLACDEDLTIFADPRLVRLIARNLVGNSYKYRRLDTPLHIIVAIEESGSGCWTLSVSDNGSGFHGQDVDPFDAFSRMREHSREEGVGLGLAMVKDAAEAMNWRAGISSVRGEGTRILFDGICLVDDDDVAA